MMRMYCQLNESENKKLRILMHTTCMEKRMFLFHLQRCILVFHVNDTVISICDDKDDKCRLIQCERIGETISMRIIEYN